MGELILPGDKGFVRADLLDSEYDRGRTDAFQSLNRAAAARNIRIVAADSLAELAKSIDFTIDQGPGDEPVSESYVAGARSVIPSARVVWNDGQRITVIDEGESHA